MTVMATPAPKKVANDFKQKVWVHVHDALTTLCKGYFSDGFQVAKEEENQLYEIMTLDGIEQKSQSFIPHSQVIEYNPFSEEHDFGHHPHERRVEVHDMIDFEGEFKGGIQRYLVL